MSRTPKNPKYRLHKQSGQAVVTLPDGLGGRRDVLLGEHDSRESKAEYDKVIAEWLVNGRRLKPATEGNASGLFVNELLEAYWEHARRYYRHRDGRPTSEADNIKLALRPVRELYGMSYAEAFNSLSLEAVRQRMIADGHCRNRINKDINRIRRAFKWTCARRMIPDSIHQSLMLVEGLRAGRSAAKETAPIRPAPMALVEAVHSLLRPQTRAMVELQMATGMRPGEVTVMRTMDLDMSGTVWSYRPGSDQGPHGAHKTAWRGHDRVIFLGPRAQQILKPWLRLDRSAYLFQPREAEASRDAERRANRKSKIPPSQAKRKAKKNPKKAPRDQYAVGAYSRAIRQACLRLEANRREVSMKEFLAMLKSGEVKAADVPTFHPNQLRHLKATEIRRKYGIDAARVVLGHRSPQITETYAEIDVNKAAEVMAKLG
jgi:integrase